MELPKVTEKDFSELPVRQRTAPSLRHWKNRISELPVRQRTRSLSERPEASLF